MIDVMQDAMLTDRPPKMSRFFWIFIPMMLLVLVMTFGWQWSIGSGLRNKLPNGVQMNYKLYRAFTIVPIAYFICYIGFILLMASKLENIEQTINPLGSIQMFFSLMIGTIILLPFGLFAIFCMYYNFYYCAKTLKSIELGREAELGDYIGYFFLFWFNFVGFWIIQPSVNKITAEGWTPPPTPPGYQPKTDPNPTFDPVPEKEVYPTGERLKTKDHEAFEHDDDFDGLF
jgi:hypothetical protein